MYAYQFDRVISKRLNVSISIHKFVSLRQYTPQDLQMPSANVAVLEVEVGTGRVGQRSGLTLHIRTGS